MDVTETNISQYTYLHKISLMMMEYVWVHIKDIQSVKGIMH